MKITTRDGRDVTLDFATAIDAAERIAKKCRDMGYVPPEAGDVIKTKLREIAGLMNALAIATGMRSPAPTPEEIASLKAIVDYFEIARVMTATLEKIARIVGNTRRMRKDALVGAVALEIVAPLEGRRWTAICCWCLDRVAHDLPDELAHRVSYGPSAGPCVHCPYVGPDVLVASLADAVYCAPIGVAA